jgi:hypothetical protein
MTFMLGQVDTSGDKVQPLIVSMTTAVSDACEVSDWADKATPIVRAASIPIVRINLPLPQVQHLSRALPSELLHPILTYCSCNKPGLRNAAVSLLDSRLRCRLGALSMCISVYQRVSACINVYHCVSTCIIMYQHLSAAVRSQRLAPCRGTAVVSPTHPADTA